MFSGRTQDSRSTRTCSLPIRCSYEHGPPLICAKLNYRTPLKIKGKHGHRLSPDSSMVQAWTLDSIKGQIYEQWTTVRCKNEHWTTVRCKYELWTTVRCKCEHWTTVRCKYELWTTVRCKYEHWTRVRCKYEHWTAVRCKYEHWIHQTVRGAIHAVRFLPHA